MDIRNIADKAAAGFINGVNAANPNHEHVESLGLADDAPKSYDYNGDEVTMLAGLTAGTGVAIAVGSKAFDLIGLGTDEVVRFGIGTGLGGVALGAAIYGMGRITRR